MKLSLVVPCYNEAENVAAFQNAVIGAFDGCGYDYEIVFVNDGSKDATLHNLKKLFAAQACPVKVISFPAISERNPVFTPVWSMPTANISPSSMRTCNSGRRLCGIW